MNYNQKIEELKKLENENQEALQIFRIMPHDPKNIRLIRLRYESRTISEQLSELIKEQENYCRTHSREQFNNCMNEKANYANKNTHCEAVRWTELNKCLNE